MESRAILRSPAYSRISVQVRLKKFPSCLFFNFCPIQLREHVLSIRAPRDTAAASRLSFSYKTKFNASVQCEQGFSSVQNCAKRVDCAIAKERRGSNDFDVCIFCNSFSSGQAETTAAKPSCRKVAVPLLSSLSRQHFLISTSVSMIRSFFSFLRTTREAGFCLSNPGLYKKPVGRYGVYGRPAKIAGVP